MEGITRGAEVYRNFDQRFRLAAEAYVAGIDDLSMLEALFYDLHSIDPWEHHLQAWSDGLEFFFYYIVRDIAKRGTKEAYDVFLTENGKYTLPHTCRELCFEQ